MIAKRAPSGLRAAALMAALFAITLNFLQPLALAAATRDGGAGTWTVFCKPNGEPGDQKQPMTQQHECCLGLAQAPALIAPQAIVVATPRIVSAQAPLLVNDTPASFAIRDGPSQPRAPPLHS